MKKRGEGEEKVVRKVVLGYSFGWESYQFRALVSVPVRGGIVLNTFIYIIYLLQGRENEERNRGRGGEGRGGEERGGEGRGGQCLI